jgi:hypothetical protein
MIAPTWLVVKSLWLTLWLGIFVIAPLVSRHPSLEARLDMQKCVATIVVVAQADA